MKLLEWKNIPGFEDGYEIARFGGIRNKRTGLLMKQSRTRNRHLQVRLSKNNKHHSFYVHRLVALAFIENPHNLPVVDHIDGNGYKNFDTNLRWCTVAQNTQNRPKANVGRSRFKGVSPYSTGSGKWLAHIMVDGRLRHIGIFATEEDAALAYNREAKAHFREFAYLNKI